MPADPKIVEKRALPKRPAPQPGDIAQAAEWLRAAKAPLVVLGGGAADAAPAIRRLVAHLDAPVVNTVNAKGILPPNHPLRIGENMAFPSVHRAIAEADVVLAIGTEFGETEMYPDPQPLVFRDKLIRVDIDPEQLVRGVSAHLPILADAGLAVAALNSALNVPEKALTGSDSAGAKRAAIVRAATPKHWWPAVSLHHRLGKIVLDALPDVIIAGDSTEPVYAGNQFYAPDRPRSWFNSSTGYGTLGYALPAAIGAKAGMPERTVWAVDGDGCFQMTAQELVTATTERIPIKVAILNNAYLGMVRQWQEMFYEERYSEVYLSPDLPDYVKWAEAMGCVAFRVESPEEVAPTIEKANAINDRPVVVEFRTDASEKVFPMVPPGQSNSDIVVGPGEEDVVQ